MENNNIDKIETENIYSKILQIRQKMNETTFTKEKQGYKYNYLDYPTLCAKLDTLLYEKNLFIQIIFEDNQCIASVFDVSNPKDVAVFCSPIVIENNVAGASPIQSIGAMHTYMRRYMKLLIFDIVIEDEVDKQANNYNKTNTSKEYRNKTTSEKPIQKVQQDSEPKQKQQSIGKGEPVDIFVIEEILQKIPSKKGLNAQQIYDKFAGQNWWNNKSNKPITAENIKFYIKQGWL